MAFKTIATGVATIALLAMAVACSSIEPPPPCAGGDPAVVCTAEGPVRGSLEGGLLAVRGIPYAAPPVGPKRWQPPAKAAPWSGTRDGTRFGNVCPQLAGPDVVGDEDCLTVNVWAPRPAPAKPLPVMVFFTGGGNHGFSGQGAGVFGGVKYDGSRLAPEGAVFVSFNYRLGALGFLTTDTLAGNYGSLDQIAMLQWLQRNIAAFGGDPKRVFLFGTSAGGGNLCALMTAPAARGLFHGVSMQSSVPTGCEIATAADLRAGSGQRVAQALGCTDEACLRSKTTAEVVKALPGTFGLSPRLYGPNVDGRVFPEQPLAVIRRGAHAHMPVIVGNSTLETMQFVGSAGPVPDAAAYAAAVRKLFGADGDRVLATYPASAHATPRDALVRLTTDGLFTCQARRVARTLAAVQREPVYRYLFDHRLENDPEQRALGAVHTIEHPFFFGWAGTYRPTADDLAVQRLLVSHWTGVARDGATTAWPAAFPGDTWLWVTPTPDVRSDDPAQCAFWDTVTLPWPHL
ncbi:carboxylesterase/lipase family protein [Piscinibacter gummiphilus]|uniref:Carboxylic ester hydrolase n=1 Tax=Piscinibacter gummiphilus TaxID=946333 RepID=A0A1W6LE12_9BURK|nr:carboxylesterase family protein [Piscinibacter gummiphilus]ARN22501.1 hypothetical protein A4W93_22750 [Piscinibacter gummiphilus]GLS98086.1 carboxylic ester hydrolase [Piscinibacter gummiphilus]